MRSLNQRCGEEPHAVLSAPAFFLLLFRPSFLGCRLVECIDCTRLDCGLLDRLRSREFRTKSEERESEREKKKEPTKKRTKDVCFCSTCLFDVDAFQSVEFRASKTSVLKFQGDRRFQPSFPSASSNLGRAGTAAYYALSEQAATDVRLTSMLNVNASEGIRF